MKTASAGAHANANPPAAQSCSASCTNVQFTVAVMRKAQEIFGRKIPEEIAARTKAALRTAYHWKAGERQMGVEDYLALLDGDEAVEFLKVFWDRVPERARERWINQELLSRRIKAAEEKAHASKRELEQMKFELTKR